MKYVKTFEESKYDIHIKDLLKPAPSKSWTNDLEGARFKIGDLVKVKEPSGLEDKIFVITQVGTSIINEFIYDTENIDPDDPDGYGWSKERMLSLVSDSEYKEWLIKKTSEKFNI